MGGSQSDIADWDRNAERYVSDAWTAEDRTYAQLQDTLWASIGDVKGLQVLDVGCGHGVLAGRLFDRGAQVVGVDGSAEFIARAEASCPGARFLRHDLARGLPALEQTFDLITATMVLMDIPDLHPLFRGLHARCRHGTRLIITITHPCFFFSDLSQDTADGSWFRKVKTYLTHEVWHIPTFGGHNHYHRPLSFYFDLLRRSGFLVSRFFEPTPIVSAAATAPEFRREIPVFLLIEAVHLSGAA
jgi:SAM-dependent methyltransferase